MLFRKKHEIQSASLSRLAWRKFARNPLGAGSMLFIGIFLLMALLGYLITPDQTPFANDQCLELGLKKPGFRCGFINIPNDLPTVRPSFLHVMLFGKPIDAQAYPVIAGKVTLPAASGVPVVMLPDDAVRNIVGAFYTERIYLLGTDRFGRDVLSQLIIGSRVSLSVGFISVLISLIIGILVGSLGGFYGGRTDKVVMWFINVIWSVPTLLLVIAITFALGKGFWQVFIAVGLTMWVEVARVVRGQILGIREKEYVEAGRALGFSDFRLIVHHILPNVMGIVIVISAANFASAILLEAGLSFLGMGVQPPVPSWGMMIKENYPYIVLDYAYLAIMPGAAIMMLVLAFMLMGNALRDALDVRTSVSSS